MRLTEEILLICLFSILAFNCTEKNVSQPVSNAEIRGKAIYESNKGAIDTRIEALQNAKEITFTIIKTETGDFLLDDLESGTYDLIYIPPKDFLPGKIADFTVKEEYNILSDTIRISAIDPSFDDTLSITILPKPYISHEEMLDLIKESGCNLIAYHSLSSTNQKLYNLRIPDLQNQRDVTIWFLRKNIIAEVALGQVVPLDRINNK